MKIFDLITTELQEAASRISPVPNPLVEDDVLGETTLLDLLHYMLYSTTALLMDLRTSLYFDQGNTGVMVFRKVKETRFTNNFDPSFPPRHVWTLGDSSITKTKSGLEFLLPFAKGDIRIVASQIEFYIGNADNIGDVASSLDEGIENYVSTTPHWESEFEVTASSSRR